VVKGAVSLTVNFLSSLGSVFSKWDKQVFCTGAAMCDHSVKGALSPPHTSRARAEAPACAKVPARAEEPARAEATARAEEPARAARRGTGVRRGAQ
jgi:hypothetical protein